MSSSTIAIGAATNRNAASAPHSAAPVEHPSQFFIGGDWVEPSSDAQIQVINPTTEAPFFAVAEAQEADINRAVAAAREAFDVGPWPRMSHRERAGYLRSIHSLLQLKADDISRTWSNEVGIVYGLAQAFTRAGTGAYRLYADLGDSFAFEERHAPMMGNVGLLAREPVGVVGAIIPWNGPIVTLANKVAPALIAGCTVVIKASPEAPGSAYLMAQIAQEVGLPPGVLNVVTADRQVSELLVRHAGVDKITFTGSSVAGRRIASICGDRVARCTLELGGKSAAVILDDYDLATAAASIAGSACMISGQVCSSLTRLIVSRHRHGAFLEALSAEFSKVRIGDPMHADTQMGPLAMRRQRDRVEHYIAKGIEEGATLAAGGRRPAQFERGFFIEPTVFGNVSNDSTIGREEIFGPVVSVIPADDEEQAVHIANDTIYGLNASVFTHDVERAYSVARRLRSGTVGHNSTYNDFAIGFGGFKQSGIGREGGVEGLLPFLESKTIILDAEPAHIARSVKSAVS
jgi:aldehyde dehydrogenase (NAD+)